ncbi:MAG: AMP-binding protein [Pseudomonadota bacterium]
MSSAPDSNASPTAGAWVGGSTVGTLFRQRALIDRHAVAVIQDERTITFGELNARSCRLATVLLSRGIQRGDRIAVLTRNCSEYLEMLLAAAKIGAILAVQNWRLADEELTHCINLAAPKLTIVAPEYAATLDRLPIEATDRIIVGRDYEMCLSNADAREPNVSVDPEDGLVILYTSGTTGLPKGALINHRAMIARAMVFMLDLGLPAGEAFVAWAPFFHMASTDHALATLLRGGAAIVIDGYDPERLIRTVQDHRIGWLPLIPGMLENFVGVLRDARPNIRSIRTIGAMPDLVPPHQIAEATELLQAPYVNSFGATETGLPPGTGVLIPIGEVPTDLAKRQSSFCEVKLVDAGDQEVPIGTPGECAIRGPTVFSGYWRAPETNAKDFRGGWFHMGDVFARREDGRFEFMDRVKYMIKSGGENIYPAEIERVLLSDPRVDDAVVVRRRDDKWGEVPVAAIALNDPTLTAEDLKTQCREALAGYKQPKDIRFVAFADFPRSTTGKIQRHEVEKWFVDDQTDE